MQVYTEEPQPDTSLWQSERIATWTCGVSHRWSAENLICRGLTVRSMTMSATIIGYARCSTDDQDLTAQRQRLTELGVADERIYLDHGLTGTNRARPGLNQALAAVRAGDTLVVPKLDRLAAGWNTSIAAEHGHGLLDYQACPSGALLG